MLDCMEPCHFGAENHYCIMAGVFRSSFYCHSLDVAASGVVYEVGADCFVFVFDRSVACSTKNTVHQTLDTQTGSAKSITRLSSCRRNRQNSAPFESETTAVEVGLFSNEERQNVCILTLHGDKRKTACDN